MYEYFEELDEMNWSARGNVLNQYLRNTSIGTTVKVFHFVALKFARLPDHHIFIDYGYHTLEVKLSLSNSRLKAVWH